MLESIKEIYRSDGSTESIEVAGRSRSDMVQTRDRVKSEAYLNRAPSGTPERTANVDFGAIANYFLGFWRAQHAALALHTLERYESKRLLKHLRQKYGQWCPPSEVAHALKKPQLPVRSHLPDTKDCRNLHFVLKMLGCSIHENRPYKQFLKAKSIRQKRLWIYKYMKSKPEEEYTKYYNEPICHVRLRRLFHFFPDRFKEQGDSIYFNDRLITYDKKRNVFFFGLVPDDDNESD